MAAIQSTPEGADLRVRHFHDASIDVTQGLTELSKAGLVGGGLAIVFVFIFLRKLRTTVLIGIAVPISVVVTFVIIYLLRQAGATAMTLNVMSLMGLMLAVGMLLDNSIVVIESVFRHRQELGADAKTAALRGASEVAMPIIASTATTMCVFLPMIFLGSGGGGSPRRGGGFSRYMGDIGLTVCVVMVASLVVSLTVVPMVAAFLLRSETKSRDGVLQSIVRAYGRMVGFTLRHRLAFALIIGAVLFGSWKLYNSIERTFAPPSEGRQVDLFIDTPRRYSLEQRKVLFDEVYELLDSKREQWEIADIAHSFRRSGGRSRSRYGGGSRFEIYLIGEDESKKPTADIRDEIREALPVKAGVTFKIAQSMHGPRGDSGGVTMELVGDELEVLEMLTPRITDQLAQLPFLRDVDTSLESGDEEIRLSVNRERALQAGLSTQAVAQTVSSALSSRSLSYFKTEDREIGLVMQYREQDRETLEQLKKMPVFQSEGALPISSLASFDVEKGGAHHPA